MYKIPALVLVLLLSFYSCALRVQTTKGSTTGRETDTSEAPIPSAKVAAVNNGTNFRYKAATNGDAEYTLANLPPGLNAGTELELRIPGSRAYATIREEGRSSVGKGDLTQE